MKPEHERLEQHNVLIPRFVGAELRRIHFRYQQRTGRVLSYADFFRDVVLAVGMTTLSERYREEDDD
jgi:hypothetical protein